MIGIKFPNRVQEERIAQKISREELARMVGITRQSIRLIEIGDVCPSAAVAIHLARALRTSVETLFSEDEDRPIRANLAGVAGDDERVYLTALGGSWMARPIRHGEVASISQPAHGTIIRTRAEEGIADVQLFHDPEQVRDTIFIAGCEIGLDLLSHFIRTKTLTTGAVWFNRSNQKAVSDLLSETAHVAAIHYSLSHPAKLPHHDVSVVYFASEEMGWIVPKGNPKGFRDVEQLFSGKFRMINREKGSGARDLIDLQLQMIGSDMTKVPGYEREVNGHLAVVEAVAMGVADIGMAHASAAVALGLDFIPLQKEESVLLVPRSLLDLPRIQQMLDVLNTSRFLRELRALGPYDTLHTGQLIRK